MGATYGCYTGLKVFSLLGDLIAFPGEVGGAGLWEFLAQEFPSTSTDSILQSAKNGSDAMLASVKDATIISDSYEVNSDTYNPGSLLYLDRVDDANTYLTLLSMAVVGSLENRYGAPSPNYHKSVPLPWTTAALTEGDGCAFAAALLNMSDGFAFLGSRTSSGVGEAYTQVHTFLNLALDTACAAGCTACGGGVSCTSCPYSLRDRSTCTGVNTDTNSCATAGIITFVNASWAGPP